MLTGLGAVDPVARLIGMTVPICEAGFQHPTVCCLGRHYQPTTCLENGDSPFSACDNGWFAYPDPIWCCSLEQPSNCVEARQAPERTFANSVVAKACASICPPGAYPGTSLYTWMTDFCCLGTGDVGICHELGENCTYRCCDPACCAACPIGWDAQSRFEPDLCCRNGANGERLCFSEATYIPGETGGVGDDGSTHCQKELWSDDSNDYYMTCDWSGTPTCSCWKNGTQVETTSATHCDLTLCGFPTT